MTNTMEFYLWVALLTSLLIYPVGKLMWVLSVRRLEKKLQKKLSEKEYLGQRRRGFFLGFLVSLMFSLMFNFNSMGHLLK